MQAQIEKLIHDIELKHLNNDDIIKELTSFSGNMSLFFNYCLELNKEDFIESVSLAYFKYKILHWNELSPTQTIYFNDKEKQDRENFTHHLNQHIQAIENKNDWVSFFKNGTWTKLLNELQEKPCYHYIEQHIDAYLDSDNEASKIRFLDNFSFGLSQDNLIKKIKQNMSLFNVYEHYPSILNEKLSHLPKNLELHSLSFYKNDSLEGMIKFIHQSCEHIENIFEMKSTDSIGYHHLSLNFATQGSNAELANYLPSLNTIFVNPHCLKEGVAYLVHEYTHYLQDMALSLDDVSYQKHVPNKFKNFQEWKDIERILRSHIKPNIHDLTHQFMSAYRPTSEQESQFVSLGINVDLVKQKFDFIETNFKALFLDKINLTHLKNTLNESNLLNDLEKKKYFHHIKKVYNAYHDTSYEVSLWKKLDKEMNQYYFQKNFEVHARLVEQLVKERFYYAVGQEKMNQIKPILTQFNQLILSLAKENLTSHEVMSPDTTIVEKIQKYRQNLIEEQKDKHLTNQAIKL